MMDERVWVPMHARYNQVSAREYKRVGSSVHAKTATAGKFKEGSN